MSKEQDQAKKNLSKVAQKLPLTRVNNEYKRTRLQILQYYLDNFDNTQLKERGMTRESLTNGIEELRVVK